MKLFAIFLSGLCLTASAQNNCIRPEIKAGTRLIYTGFVKPAPTYINAAYFKESPKNQQKIKEKFEKENPPQQKVRTLTFEEVKEIGPGQMLVKIVSAEQGSPISATTYMICRNDTVAALQPEQVDLRDNQIWYNRVVDQKNAQGEVIGFSEFGVRTIPPIKEVGQVMPDYTFVSTVTSSGPQKVEWEAQKLTKVTRTNYINFTGSNTIHTYSTFENEYTPVKAQAMLETTTYSEMLYKNRKITAQKEVQVGDQKYTAWCLYEEIWTGLPTYQVDSDNSFVRRINERMAKTANKQTVQMLRKAGSNVNEKGYMVTKIETWLIPGVGGYESYVYEPDGSKMRSVVLTKIE